MLLAALAGSFTPADSIPYHGYAFIGDLFLNALKMVVMPLIICSIICAVMDVSGGDFGRLGLKTALFYILTTSLAAFVGLLMVGMIQPGNSEVLQSLLSEYNSEAETAIEKVSGTGFNSVLEVFLRMIPSNVFNAASNGDILGLIFFSIIFGYFISTLDDENKNTMQKFWRAAYKTMMRITEWILVFAPIGVFGLIAEIVSDTGFAAFIPMLKFFFTVCCALVFHSLVTHSLILYYIVKINPIRHIKAMGPALLTAFSTASSSATLPVTINCVTKRIGVSKRVTGFVLPMGTTLNMDGTALYECVAVLFIAQIFNVELSIIQQLFIVFLALVTSAGVAGIPSASLVAITIIMTSFGLPLEGIGLILITDRVLDMLRTSVNVYGDSVGASFVAKTEGEQLEYKFDRETD